MFWIFALKVLASSFFLSFFWVSHTLDCPVISARKGSLLAPRLHLTLILSVNSCWHLFAIVLFLSHEHVFSNGDVAQFSSNHAFYSGQAIELWCIVGGKILSIKITFYGFFYFIAFVCYEGDDFPHTHANTCVRTPPPTHCIHLKIIIRNESAIK